MNKWVIIQDAHYMPCYKNVNARLVYLHAAMCCDVGTYVYTTSLRRMASEVGITLDALRHALKVLQRDGLIDILTAPQPAPQGAPQGTPQPTPQPTPHLTYIRINKIETTSRTTSTTTSTTASTTSSTTENATVISNKITKDPSKSFTLSDARAKAGKLKKTAEDRFSLAEGVAAAAVNEFLDLQRLKKHSWEDEGDMAAHFIGWIEKRLWRLRNAAKTAKSDHDARLEERQRVEEEVAARTPVDTLRAEIETLRGWVRQHEKNKNKEMADTMRGALRQKEAELCELTKESGTIPSSHCG